MLPSLSRRGRGGALARAVRAGAALVTFTALLAPALPTEARASGLWLSAGEFEPEALRVAVALSPERTTLWTSLRFRAEAGALARVFPVPKGATLDPSSDALFEALEGSTAPRIFPPGGVDHACPGACQTGGEGAAFEVAGTLAHEPTLEPVEVALLDDEAAVASFAEARGLAIPGWAAAALAAEAQKGSRFFVERFDAPGGPGVARALRIVLPAPKPALPLALARAGEEPLAITAFLLGPGRADLEHDVEALLDPGKLSWRLAEGRSSYLPLREGLLAALGKAGSLLEASGHDALAEARAIGDGGEAIDAFVSTYFERASGYGDALDAFEPCVERAADALGSPKTVATSCPRGELGVVGGVDTCTELPALFEQSPDALRCGPGADDLAVALSKASPSGIHLTRLALRLPPGASGPSFALAFEEAPDKLPLLEAAKLDASGCEGASGPGAPGSSQAGGASPGWLEPGAPGEEVSEGEAGEGASGSADAGAVFAEAAGCACVGLVEAGSSDESCSGDPGEPEGDDCSGDSSAPADEDCSGGPSDTYEEGCSGDGSDGSDGDDCAVARGDRRGGAAPRTKIRRGPRLSALVLALLAAAVPLRRGLRPSPRRAPRAPR